MGKSKRSAESGKRGRDIAADGQPDSTAVSFENALEQLERTVARLEVGEMPIEEALELFEAGVKLSRQCSTTLEEAERRIEILVGEGSESVRFESEEDVEDRSGEDRTNDEEDQDDDFED